ncbi:uncharacterized protein [Chironomus tepperi]|uniref:uncharacterized protein n=1 Tax=Chironomus tepperi TaxID=113505 RepID=UPI00391F690F
MGKILFTIMVCAIVQLTLCADSDIKCRIWLQGIEKMNQCCKVPLPVDEKQWDSYKKENLTFCERNEKALEFFNLKNADKAAYKNYLTKLINDSEWKEIFVKKSDFCFDFAPKLVPTFAKKANITEERCGTKFIIMVNCWMISAFSECPAKLLTDSAECKELAKTMKECQENPADIIKAFD